ncbi:unnamed protein product [Euphydryas editha]|uniref:Uncharacterized protein n=1 Tax=Euphydryas editha TaxID=104508 RepID=A0AAU9UTK0_EUPED|nr:unnamed protein product [Euphydryas editha]
MKQNRKRETMKSECEAIFQKINRHYIRMNIREKKEHTSILFLVLKELIHIMRKSDQLFDSLRPTLDFLGSYFDRLRIGHPNEYDINIILKFPVNYDKIILDATNSPNDYTAIIMPSEFRRLSKIAATSNQGFAKTTSWCNREFKLSMIKFRSWMQRTVDVAVNSLPLEDGMRVLIVNKKHKYKLHTKLSGPANTITIIKDDNDVINVDLVPTFSFSLPTKPINSKVLFEKVESTKILRYFVVPKPNGDDYSWRLTFPFQERYFLKNSNNLKSTIRIIKHFRDIQGFTKLSSYFIKTLFFWECASNDKSYWCKNSLSFLVLNMLYKLKESLRKRNIPNFWCPSHNVLEKIKPVTCHHWHNRICHILKDIENRLKSDPNVILEYFVKN